MSAKGDRLTYTGLHTSLKQRAADAGIIGFHLHRLRHTMALRWMRAGGSETGLMAHAGWTSNMMIGRYVKAASGSWPGRSSTSSTSGWSSCERRDHCRGLRRSRRPLACRRIYESRRILDLCAINAETLADWQRGGKTLRRSAADAFGFVDASGKWDPTGDTRGTGGPGWLNARHNLRCPLCGDHGVTVPARHDNAGAGRAGRKSCAENFSCRTDY